MYTCKLTSSGGGNRHGRRPRQQTTRRAGTRDGGHKRRSWRGNAQQDGIHRGRSGSSRNRPAQPRRTPRGCQRHDRRGHTKSPTRKRRREGKRRSHGREEWGASNSKRGRGRDRSNHSYQPSGRSRGERARRAVPFRGGRPSKPSALQVGDSRTGRAAQKQTAHLALGAEAAITIVIS